MPPILFSGWHPRHVCIGIGVTLWMTSCWIGLNKVMRFQQADDVWLSQEAETSKEQTWQLASKYSERRSSPSRWGALPLAVALGGSSPLVAVTQKCPMWWGSDGVVLNAQGVNNVWFQVTTQQVPCEIKSMWKSREIQTFRKKDSNVAMVLAQLG